jgi:hypothetical protein
MSNIVPAGVPEGIPQGTAREGQVRSGSSQPDKLLLPEHLHSTGLADPMRGCFCGGDIVVTRRPTPSLSLCRGTAVRSD